MYFFEVLVGDVSVYLGGGDRTMSEKDLNRSNVCSFHEKRGRETVPKGMRRYLFFDTL